MSLVILALLLYNGISKMLWVMLEVADNFYETHKNKAWGSKTTIKDLFKSIWVRFYIFKLLHTAIFLISIKIKKET